ncbi:hypothetical protein SAMN04487938_2136 [Lysobacter sp. cf310]|nr:hypothetical protein SAMN04487938_2136 [Lysobacter sp. cf310]
MSYRKTARVLRAALRVYGWSRGCVAFGLQCRGNGNGNGNGNK